MDLSGSAGGRSARPRRGAWPWRRPAGPSTSSAVRCCAPRCCGWSQRDHVAAAEHAPHRLRRLVHGRAGPRDHGPLRRRRLRPAVAACPSCRSSTPTSPSGSAAGSGARCWSGSSPTGGSAWPALPASLDLPADRPRPAGATYRGRAAARSRSAAASTAGLASSPAATRRRLFMVLLAAFQALLGRLTGQDDLASARPSPTATVRRSSR